MVGHHGDDAAADSSLAGQADAVGEFSGGNGIVEFAKALHEVGDGVAAKTGIGPGLSDFGVEVHGVKAQAGQQFQQRASLVAMRRQPVSDGDGDGDGTDISERIARLTLFFF